MEFIDLLDSWNLIGILISLSLQCKLEHEIFLRCLVARSKHKKKQYDTALAWRNDSERTFFIENWFSYDVN